MFESVLWSHASVSIGGHARRSATPMPGASLLTFSQKCLLQRGCRFLIRASGNGALNRLAKKYVSDVFRPGSGNPPRVRHGSHSCFQFHRDIITVGSDNRDMKTVAGTLALALSAAPPRPAAGSRLNCDRLPYPTRNAAAAGFRFAEWRGVAHVCRHDIEQSDQLRNSPFTAVAGCRE